MNEKYQKLSTIPELDRAVMYLRLGLKEVQNIESSNDFYDPVFIFLSGGLERLFKVLLSINFHYQNKRFPKPQEVWKNNQGHDLIILKAKIEQFCVPIKIPLGNSDFSIIKNDKLINQICKILSEYGKKGRFYNIDAVLGTDQDFNCKKEWEKLESSILKDKYGIEGYIKILQDHQKMETIYEISNKVIVKKLEEFLRALFRQFAFGTLSEIAKNYRFQIDDFLEIEDYQLGETNYKDFKNYQRIKR